MRSGAGVMNSIRNFMGFLWILVVDDNVEVILLFSLVIDELIICILYGSNLYQAYFIMLIYTKYIYISIRGLHTINLLF